MISELDQNLEKREPGYSPRPTVVNEEEEQEGGVETTSSPSTSSLGNTDSAQARTKSDTERVPQMGYSPRPSVIK